MDAAIADTINRLTAEKITKHLDLLDWFMMARKPWHTSAVADALMGTSASGNADRAWLVGILASRTPEVPFDGVPADCDWDNLFSHLRTEILARRNPQTLLVCAAESPRGMV